MAHGGGGATARDRRVASCPCVVCEKCHDSYAIRCLSFRSYSVDTTGSMLAFCIGGAPPRRPPSFRPPPAPALPAPRPFRASSQRPAATGSRKRRGRPAILKVKKSLLPLLRDGGKRKRKSVSRGWRQAPDDGLRAGFVRMRPRRLLKRPHPNPSPARAGEGLAALLEWLAEGAAPGLCLAGVISQRA